MDMLFGDMPLDAWPSAGAGAEAMPWSNFVSARTHLKSGSPSDAIAEWRHILDQPGLEPRPLSR